MLIHDPHPHCSDGVRERRARRINDMAQEIAARRHQCERTNCERACARSSPGARPASRRLGARHHSQTVHAGRRTQLGRRPDAAIQRLPHEGDREAKARPSAIANARIMVVFGSLLRGGGKAAVITRASGTGND